MCLEPNRIKTMRRTIDLDIKLTHHEGNVFNSSGLMASMSDVEEQAMQLRISTDTYWTIARRAPARDGTHHISHFGASYTVEVRPYGSGGYRRVVKISRQRL